MRPAILGSGIYYHFYSEDENKVAIVELDGDKTKVSEFKMVVEDQPEK